MKLAAVVIVLLIVACSLLADYKWRQWMAARRRERGEGQDRDVN